MLKRIVRGVNKSARMLRALAADPPFRNAAFRLLEDSQATNPAEPPTTAPRTSRWPTAADVRAAEKSRAPEEAMAYDSLGPAALSFAALEPSDSPRAVNVVLPSLDSTKMFAGIKSALVFADSLARSRNLLLRVVVTKPETNGRHAAGLQAFVEQELDRSDKEILLVTRDQIPRQTWGQHDVWIATHWTTAHALWVATITGRIQADRCVYLVQDYEPAFEAWSTSSFAAAETYKAGFLNVVNSSPVAAVLQRFEGISIDPGLVFAPALDLERLEAIRSTRKSPVRPMILFYARPSKPRNMFDLGVGALRVAASMLPSGSVDFVSAGEVHADIELGGGHTLTSLGTLKWDAYFRLLGECQVVLSLQATPHPSHPPLEAALSGAVAVTNDLYGSRRNLLPRLAAVSPDPRALGEAVVLAVAESAQTVKANSVLEELGKPIEEVVANVERIMFG